MRKEPPLTRAQGKADADTTASPISTDVFVTNYHQPAKAEPQPQKARRTIPSRIQIEIAIENKTLANLLPRDFDTAVAREIGPLRQAQAERKQRKESNDIKTFLIGALSTVVVGWLTYSVANIGWGPTIVISLVTLTASVTYAGRYLDNAMPADDLAEQFPDATIEQRIADALDNLNAEHKVLTRARDDGYITQQMIDNKAALERIHDRIAAARSQLEFASSCQAQEIREGKGPSSGTAVNIADAQAKLSIATAELTGAQNWRYPHVARCTDRYIVDRWGHLKKDW